MATRPAAATIDGGPPFLDPAFRVPMLPYGSDDEDANSWIRTELEKLFARDNKVQAQGVPLPGFFPITTPDMVVFRAYNGVYGVATRDQVANGRVIRAGDIRWISKTTMGIHQMVTTGDSDDIDMSKNVKDWWSTYNQTKVTQHPVREPVDRLACSRRAERLLRGRCRDSTAPGVRRPQLRRHQPAAAVSPEWRPRRRHPRRPTRGGRSQDRRSGGAWPHEVAPPDPDSKAATPAAAHRLTEEEGDKTTNAFQLCLDAVFLGLR